MFNVQGKAFITNLKEITPKLITGTVYTFRKEGEEFKTTFIKIVIKLANKLDKIANINHIKSPLLNY